MFFWINWWAKSYLTELIYHNSYFFFGKADSYYLWLDEYTYKIKTRLVMCPWGLTVLRLPHALRHHRSWRHSHEIFRWCAVLFGYSYSTDKGPDQKMCRLRDERQSLISSSPLAIVYCCILLPKAAEGLIFLLLPACLNFFFEKGTLLILKWYIKVIHHFEIFPTSAEKAQSLQKSYKTGQTNDCQS